MMDGYWLEPACSKCCPRSSIEHDLYIEAWLLKVDTYCVCFCLLCGCIWFNVHIIIMCVCVIVKVVIKKKAIYLASAYMFVCLPYICSLVLKVMR